MQLTVTADILNKRRFIPASLSDTTGIVGTVNKGYTFEGEEEANLVNPALGKWYGDRDGNFYWGGGLFAASLVTDSAVIKFDPLKMSWGHSRYDLPFIWRDLNTMGQGAIVAVIDTGVDTDHQDLKPNILETASKSYVEDKVSIEDKNGHGTNMAGIIAGVGNKVFGVAPESKLIILRATISSKGNPALFAQAVVDAASSDAQIVSISYAFGLDNEALKTGIQACIAAGKIVVAAIGNLRDLSNPAGPDDDTYPACYNNVVSVGAFDKAGSVCSFSNWNSKLCLVAPGDDNVLTTGLNDSTGPGKGTSIATAFTSGCLALMVSYAIAKGIPLAKCVTALQSSCDDIGSSAGRDIQSGFGRLHLRNAIAKLKKP